MKHYSENPNAADSWDNPDDTQPKPRRAPFATAESLDEEIARQANAGTLELTMQLARLQAENAQLRQALECARGGLCVAAINDGTLEMVEAALSWPNNAICATQLSHNTQNAG